MSNIHLFGEYIFDPSITLLMRGIEIIDLPQRQLETLSVLLKANGGVVSREDLLDQVWKNVAVEEHNLTQSVFLLRKALGKLPNGNEYIETVPRRGYRISSHALQTRPPIKQKLAGESDQNDLRPSFGQTELDHGYKSSLSAKRPLPLWLVTLLLLALLTVIVGVIKIWVF